MKWDQFFRVEDSHFPRKHSLNLKGKLFTISRPVVMGIINVTPDSFYSGSRSGELKNTLKKAGEMIRDGAAMLDIGGYSTRPGAADVSENEELTRVIPVIEMLSEEFPETPLSIDTFRASVARKSIEAGAASVNDISGGDLDKNMFKTIAKLGCPYILTHSRGNAVTMQQLTEYENLFRDVSLELSEKVTQLQQLGVKDIILDPGFGFAKTIEQNFELLSKLDMLSVFGLPVLAGLSRKSIIWKTLDIKPEEALNGTTVLNTAALMKGVNILRVHDVKEAVQAIRLVETLMVTGI